MSTDELCGCLEMVSGAALIFAGTLQFLRTRDIEPSGSAASAASAASIQPKCPRGAVASLQGRRPTMEDGHSMVESPSSSSSSSSQYNLYAVYDGHGGSKAAAFMEERFPAAVEKFAAESDDVEQIVRKAVAEMEDEFVKMAKADQLDDGTTMVCALISNGKLVVANVGDSEAILYRNGTPLPLSVIHNPKRNDQETARITAAGGRVVKGRLGHPHLNPQYFSIAVSRAIGDIMYKLPEHTSGKDSGMIATPDVSVVLLSPDSDLLILACDGVWDVIGYQVSFLLACV
jgi:serine/threonine protein phosphatase PrpC